LDDSSTTDFVDFSSKGRSQFIEQLEAFINLKDDGTSVNDGVPAAQGAQGLPEGAIDPEDTIVRREDFADDLTEDLELIGSSDDDSSAPSAPADESPDKTEASTMSAEGKAKAAEFEQVMTNGMQFLAGLFKMSTGKDLGVENQQIKLNEETGEVTMTFKLPL
jgi:hypothetical protein